MARVVVGISGGVDSSVAAYLLKQQGHDVIGLFMINWHDTTGTLEGDCAWHDDRVFAELVAKKLDIALHVVDLSEHYRTRVVEYMFSEYEKGRTPNPDVLCNREIKFDVFLKEALKLGADYVATGHYCRRGEVVTPSGERIYQLLAGKDGNKDQSYFLCQLSQEQLSKAMFPIGDLIKPEVRAIADEQKLATAKRKDSQGICFVGKVDLPVFLQQQLAKKEGNIHEIKSDWSKFDRELLTMPTQDILASTDDALFTKLSDPYNFTVRDGKKIGTHGGAHFYTIGQRKGLGIGGRKESLYIIGTDVAQNVIYVGEGDNHQGLHRRVLHILPEEIHWVNPMRELKVGEQQRFMVRIRYRQPLQGATLVVRESGCYIIFDEPQRGIAAGQFAAWYDGDELVGSGVISR
ncbi:MAG: tRNA 2-thiouridine(34) synthase MnmA [Rikenellaceae bacterium]